MCLDYFAALIFFAHVNNRRTPTMCVPRAYGLPPYLHDASPSKNVNVSNASRTTHSETHLETIVCCSRTRCCALAWWTMMTELCFSVYDFILDFFSNTAADTASEYDGYGRRRCCTAAASCPCYSCRRHAKPVGLVLPRVCCCLLYTSDAADE